MTSVIVQSVPPSQTGVATGVNNNVRNIGGAIGTAIFTGVITSTAGADGYPTAGGYEAAFLMLTALALTGMLVALAIPRTDASARMPSQTPRTRDSRPHRVVTAPVNVWSASDEDWQ